jgi:hypothetical protein
MTKADPLTVRAETFSTRLAMQLNDSKKVRHDLESVAYDRFLPVWNFIAALSTALPEHVPEVNLPRKSTGANRVEADVVEFKYNFRWVNDQVAALRFRITQEASMITLYDGQAEIASAHFEEDLAPIFLGIENTIAAHVRKAKFA